jgi:hypothetical protein
MKRFDTDKSKERLLKFIVQEKRAHKNEKFRALKFNGLLRK